MVKLSDDQLNAKIQFMKQYTSALNPATGSQLDANANITVKNIASMFSELYKDFTIQINRKLVQEKIKERFTKKLSIQYIRDIEDHLIYVHDESSLNPYTYGPSEAIVVYRNSEPLLTTFENLYELYSNVEEVLLDEEKGVYCKFPEDLYIDDYKGRTKITRLIKKDRHRDLVRVKTQYGEDLIVTDNHPMIIDKDNINNNCNAIDSIGKLQFKKIIPHLGVLTILDVESKFNFINYGSYCLSKENNGKKIEGIKPFITLGDKLGYVVGFFISEGHYYSNNFVSFCQNDETVLRTIANYIYDEIGICGKISKDTSPSHSNRSIKYTLNYSSMFLYELLHDFFGIKPYAQRKNLPENTYSLNKNFIEGLISGIIDGDGSVNRSISIRVVSRSLISQLSILLKSFNFGVSNTYQEQTEVAFGSYSSNYPIFGISFGLSGDFKFNLSYKVNAKRSSISINNRYTQDESKIIEVKQINNKKFLDSNIYDITTESSEFICNNLRVHNCVSISMYPFLVDGLIKLGGESHAPTHLESFCGSFGNLIFAISSQFAGAVATPEFFMIFDYFARKDYGDNYLNEKSDLIAQKFQHIVYVLTQPAAARGYQSVFFNVSTFDKYFFDGLFSDFVFPDCSKPNWDTINKLQKFFHKWFRKERERALLTFPVVTHSALTDGVDFIDKEWKDFIAEEMSKGGEFFIYSSPSVDSLSSCCRLRNAIDNEFSYSIGGSSVMTGSINVITLNINRIIQEGIDLNQLIDRVHKYQIAFNDLYKQYFDSGMLTVYNAGFIDLKKQFLTLGINGVVEAAEYLGFKISNNKEYKEWLINLLKTFKVKNKAASLSYGVKFNTEFTPAENLGVKNAMWDKIDGLVVSRDVYNSYLYVVEDYSLSIFDKMQLHGGEILNNLDGGSATHWNNNERLNKDQYIKMLEALAKYGCNYFCENVPKTICNDCGYIHPNNMKNCVKCESTNIEKAVRIIGYLKKISYFSKDRQLEESRRYYHDKIS